LLKEGVFTNVTFKFQHVSFSYLHKTVNMELVIACANNYAVFTPPGSIKRRLLHDFKTILAAIG
jgi:hypothetical protein